MFNCSFTHWHKRLTRTFVHESGWDLRFHWAFKLWVLYWWWRQLLNHRRYYRHTQALSWRELRNQYFLLSWGVLITLLFRGSITSTRKNQFCWRLLLLCLLSSRTYQLFFSNFLHLWRSRYCALWNWNRYTASSTFILNLDLIRFLWSLLFSID